MTLLRTYEDLDAWKAAHEFTLAVYRATEDFPKKELFGIVSQVRRSAVSVPANLAEGFGRRSDNELLRFCRISEGLSRHLSQSARHNAKGRGRINGSTDQPING